jgi:hypothetical protein
MTAFGLNKSHAKIVGWTSLIASVLAIIFLQIPGVFWFAMVASLTAQLIAKFKRHKINFEVAFGIGFLTLIIVYLIFLLFWMIIEKELNSWDSYASLMAIFFIIGFVQQLVISSFFIWFGNNE